MGQLTWYIVLFIIKRYIKYKPYTAAKKGTYCKQLLSNSIKKRIWEEEKSNREETKQDRKEYGMNGKVRQGGVINDAIAPGLGGGTARLEIEGGRFIQYPPPHTHLHQHDNRVTNKLYKHLRTRSTLLKTLIESRNLIRWQINKGGTTLIK